MESTNQVTKPKPKAVIINDIHFSVQNLELASSALEHAIEKAYELEVPLIIAGDLLDSKAIIRGEVANRLIDIFRQRHAAPVVYILVGNHDLINEKSSDNSLNFLLPYAEIIHDKWYSTPLNLWMFAYHSDVNSLKVKLSDIAKGSTVIMHQGMITANMGHYVQDKSALTKEDVADFRVISGHYHRKQDIKCGRPRKGAVGLFSYTGSPYTQSFAEAEDGPKGFHVLMDNGMIEFEELPFRRHKIIHIHADNPSIEMPPTIMDAPAPDDIVWIKLYGAKSELDKIEKKDLVNTVGHMNFKLEKLPDESIDLSPVKPSENKSDSDIFDSIIEGLTEPPEHKEYLKLLWKEIYEAR